MEMIEYVKLVTAFIVSIGGSSVVIIALSKWFGNFLSTRLLDAYNNKHEKELEVINKSMNKEHKYTTLYKSSIFPSQGVELHKTVLAHNFAFNQIIKNNHQQVIVYSDRTTISEYELSKHNIIFKQLPFSIKDK